jgi:hypothetical protein
MAMTVEITVYWDKAARLPGATFQQTIIFVMHVSRCHPITNTQSGYRLLFSSVLRLLKPSGYYICHQVKHSTILRSAHTVFMRFECISEQTATIT